LSLCYEYLGGEGNIMSEIRGKPIRYFNCTLHSRITTLSKSWNETETPRLTCLDLLKGKKGWVNKMMTHPLILLFFLFETNVIPLNQFAYMTH
jgi:hypothetical protein